MALEEKKRPPRRKWLAIAIPAGVLVLLLLTALILGNSGTSAFSDDIEAILASGTDGDIGEVTFADDGSAQLRLYKNDIYLIAERDGYLDAVRSEVQDRFGDADFGFRISDGKMRVCISREILGIATVSVTVQTGVSWDGTDIVIHPESVMFGTRTNLPEKFWPRGLRSDFVVDLNEGGRSEQIADIYLEGSCAVVETVPLSLPSADSLHPDEQIFEEIRFFSTDETANAALELFNRLAAGDIPTEEELPAGSRAELIAWLKALEDEDDSHDDMFASFFESYSKNVREQLQSELTTAEDKYVKLLTTVREYYKSGALRLEVNGFSLVSTGETFDPFVSSELSATATDARVVLLTSAGGSEEVTTADVPVLKNVERSSKKAIEGLDPEHAYDIGVVLTTDTGVPVLLARRADGTVTIREITEEKFVEILVSGTRPTIDVDTLPLPENEYTLTSCTILTLQ